MTYEAKMSTVAVCFSSRRRHTRFGCDWSSDVCSSDLAAIQSAQTLSELADRVRDEGAGWLGVGSVTIWLSEPDGALQLTTCSGVSPQVASDWQRIPSGVRAPARDAISLDEPVWIDGGGGPHYGIMRGAPAAAG